MHGPAVLSLLAGESIGVAPDARVYYAAAPSWLGDAKVFADALLWIIAENEALPSDDKIRVVSVSAAPSGPGSPFKINNSLWDEAVKKAETAGLVVLDCTSTHGFIGPGYYDPADPENVNAFVAGFPGRKNRGGNEGMVYAPCSFRSSAEEYRDGQETYQYTGTGGLSWAIPYVAGVMAMGWQIRPEAGGPEMVEILKATAHKNPDGAKVVDPRAFIEELRGRGVTNPPL
jgi:hypothetical protein